ncbi:MAG TPA: phosphatase PAP2 family protein [Anaerolineales bacterium]
MPPTNIKQSNAPTGSPVEKAGKTVHEAARAEAVPAPERRSRTRLFEVALAGVLGALVMLTILIKTSPLLPVDIQITRAFQSVHNPTWATLMSIVSWPGFPPQVFLLTAAIVVLIYFLGWHWEALAAVAAAVISSTVNELVKLAFARARPTVDLVQVFAPLNSYSFPSGHVMYYVTFLGFLWFLVFTLLKSSVKRNVALILLTIPILLVGVSRIYLGEHWASDVVGAYLLGSLTLTASILFYRWGKKRFFIRQPVSPHEPGRE